MPTESRLCRKTPDRTDTVIYKIFCFCFFVGFFLFFIFFSFLFIYLFYLFFFFWGGGHIGHGFSPFDMHYLLIFYILNVTADDSYIQLFAILYGQHSNKINNCNRSVSQ